jgi:diguanylate cyclase (GGDEF)-like protein
MTRDTTDPSGWIPRQLLVLSFVVLAIPAGVVILVRESPPEVAFLWFVAVVPILLWGYAFRWRGAVAALAISLALLVAVEAAAAARGFGGTPLLLELFLALIVVTVGIGLLVERLQHDRGDLEEVALTDRLTALPNRRHARVFLETMFGAAERGRPVSVVLFDLDGFRGYNDRMGAREGDEALRAFAQLLASSTRRMNLSARLGGEEFMSILSGADEEGARAFADRVRETFRLSRPASRELTVSAGVASFHPSMRTPDELVGAADLALFRAKEEGGDRVRVFGRDVRARDAAALRGPSAEGVGAARPPTAPGAGHPPAPAVGATDFARPPEELGKSPPPPELLPPPDPRFGIGRKLLILEPPPVVAEEDDDDASLSLAGFLEREGFDVVAVTEPARAHVGLAEEVDVILADLDFLGAQARDFIRAAKSRWPSTQLVTLSGDESGLRTTDGMAAGADDALSRPLELRLLQATLVDGLSRRDRLQAEEAARVEAPTFSETTSGRGERLLSRGLLSLVRAGELRDPHTRGHARRVARYSAALLAKVEAAHGIDSDALVRACLVHDIGKLEIPEAILVKNAPLTAEEFGKVRRHPAVGREMLRPLLRDPLTLAVAGWHHERWDGGGYPDGLAAEAIPLAARIVAIADALDAMTSPRAYRPGLSWEDAVRQVRERFGSHYDPGLAEPFRRAHPDLHRIYREAWAKSEG